MRHHAKASREQPSCLQGRTALTARRTAIRKMPTPRASHSKSRWIRTRAHRARGVSFDERDFVCGASGSNHACTVRSAVQPTQRKRSLGKLTLSKICLVDVVQADHLLRRVCRLRAIVHCVVLEVREDQRVALAVFLLQAGNNLLCIMLIQKRGLAGQLRIPSEERVADLAAGRKVIFPQAALS